jgi:pSer/pThr/pTyr-binding forkhead associated (FHA) protein
MTRVAFALERGITCKEAEPLDMLVIRYKDRTFAVPETTATIGRSSGAQFQITHYMVSRKHCTVKSDGDHILVHDLGSSNGTFINGTPVHAGHFTARAGDIIQLGTMELQITDVDALAARLSPRNPRNVAGQDEMPTMLGNRLDTGP